MKKIFMFLSAASAVAAIAVVAIAFFTGNLQLTPVNTNECIDQQIEIEKGVDLIPKDTLNSLAWGSKTPSFFYLQFLS